MKEKRNKRKLSEWDKVFLILVGLLTFLIIFFNIPQKTYPNLDLTGRPNISNNTMQIGYTHNSSYYGNLTIMNRTNITAALVINSDNPNNPEPIAKFYGNGTIWIRDKQEAKAAEQLIKFQIAYSSYLNGFCDGVRK